MPGNPVFMQVPGVFLLKGYCRIGPENQSPAWTALAGYKKDIFAHLLCAGCKNGGLAKKYCINSRTIWRKLTSRRASAFLLLRPLKWYAAVAAYHVDLPRCPDDCPALRADIFNTAVFAGLAASLYGRGFRFLSAVSRCDLQ